MASPKKNNDFSDYLKKKGKVADVISIHFKKYSESPIQDLADLPLADLADLEDFRNYLREYHDFDQFSDITKEGILQQKPSLLKLTENLLYGYLFNQLENVHQFEEKKKIFNIFAPKINKFVEESDKVKISQIFLLKPNEKSEIEKEISSYCILKHLEKDFLKTFESSKAILEFNLGKDDADKIIRGCSIDRQFNSIQDQVAYFEVGSRFERLSKQDQELHQWAKDSKDLSLKKITSEEEIKKFKEYKIKYYEKLFEERFVDKDHAKLLIDDLKKIEISSTIPCKVDEESTKSENNLLDENSKTARLKQIIDDFQKLDWKGKDVKYDADTIYKGFSSAEFKTPQELMDKLYPNSNYPNQKKESKIHKKLFDVYVDELFELALKEINKDKEIVGENESPEKKSPEEKMKFLEEVIESKKTKQEENKQKMQIQSFIERFEDIPLIAGVKEFVTLKTKILEKKGDEKDFKEILKKNEENINLLYKLVKKQEENSKKFSLEKVPNELFKIMQQNKNFEALVSCLSFGLLASEQGKAPEKKAENKEPEREISKNKKIEYIEKFIKERQSPNFQTAITDYNTLISQVLIDKAKDLFNKGQNGIGGR